MELPLGYAQEQIYYTHLLGGLRSWRLSRSWRVRGPLDVRALSAAVRSLISRHEVLRAAVLPGAEPRQSVRDMADAEIPLAKQQLLGVEESGVDDYVRKLLRRVGREDDIGQYPVCRFFLLRVSPTDHVVVASYQHIIVDGTSVALLDRQLWECYAGHAAGETVEQTGPSLTDLLLRQRERHDRRQAGARRYWDATLTDVVPVCQFNAAGPADVPTSRRVVREIVLRGDELAAARENLRHHRTNQLVTLLTALSATVFEFSRQDRFAIQLLLDPRSADAAGVVGLLAGNYPIVAHRHSDLLERMRAAVLRTISYHQVGADVLMSAELRAAERFGMQPRRSIVVDYRPIEESVEPAPIDGLTVDRLAGLEFGPSPYSLRVMARDHEDDLEIRLDFAAAVFDDAGTAEFARLLRHTLTLPPDDFAALAPGPGERTTGEPPADLTAVMDAEGAVLLSVDLPAVTTLLCEHDAVTSADVRIEDGTVVATVKADLPVTVSELRRHCYGLAATSQFVVVPGRFEIVADPPTVPTGTELAVLELIRTRLPGAADDDPFWAAGGTLADIAAIRAEAVEHGLPVPDHQDFAEGRTIRGIAAAVAKTA